ncbi:alpha/beta hydrolase [Candidatus Nomurabacteria bacterium]|nr:alpha/beta hydrolase [Candidatus Nomurabacteria bacterium]
MQECLFKDEIYYRTNEFRPDRTTLVFVHGLVGSSSAWIPYEKIFEKKYNILTYDIRGHGKSRKFRNYSDYEIKYFADDLRDLISYLKIEKFILISHSFATLIAGEYIKLYPEHVAGIVFLSPMFDLEKGFVGKILRPILKLTKIFNSFPFNAKPRGHVDYGKHPNSTDWDIKRTIADVKNTTLRVHMYILRQSLILEQEYFLEKIKVPTLIMHGLRDTMVPVKKAISLSQKIQNAEITIIPDTDHILVLNNVKEIANTLESFIEKNKKNWYT